MDFNYKKSLHNYLKCRQFGIFFITNPIKNPLLIACTFCSTVYSVMITQKLLFVIKIFEITRAH